MYANMFCNILNVSVKMFSKILSFLYKCLIEFGSWDSYIGTKHRIWWYEAMQLHLARFHAGDVDLACDFNIGTDAWFIYAWVGLMKSSNKKTFKEIWPSWIFWGISQQLLLYQCSSTWKILGTHGERNLVSHSISIHHGSNISTKDGGDWESYSGSQKPQPTTQYRQ